MSRSKTAIGATGTISGAIAVETGMVFRAESPRGPRFVQVEGVEWAADLAPVACLRERSPACAHLLAALQPGGCAACAARKPEPTFYSALTFDPDTTQPGGPAWRMSKAYKLVLPSSCD